MRITLILDDELLERAREMTGIKEKTRSRMPVWKRSSRGKRRSVWPHWAERSSGCRILRVAERDEAFVPVHWVPNLSDSVSLC